MSRKLIFLILIIALILACLFWVLMPSETEQRFKEVLDEYDTMYDYRHKTYESDTIIRCYDLKERAGFIISTEGYEDTILLYIELGPDYVENVEILYHNETEDHGGFVTEDWFLQRLYLPYKDKLVTVKNKKEHANEVIVITGATITSEAVVNAINECAVIMEEITNEED